MQLTETEQAVLKYSDDALCVLIAFHTERAKESELSERTKAYHAARAEELRAWRRRKTIAEVANIFRVGLV